MSSNPNVGILAESFRHFAQAECRGSSSLYEQLSLAIAQDMELLEIASHAAAGQPVPNLLFGTVHFLLLRMPADPLAQYYPSCTETPRSPASAYADFRAFFLRYRETMVNLLRTRRVQTNEVGRSAYLFLAFSLIQELAQNRPLSLVEIGASAGLNLLWDRFQYHYPDFGDFGDLNSPVKLECAFKGDQRPPIPKGMPTVNYRIGIDVHPMDVQNAEETMWQRALIWPEHQARAALLENAIQLAKPDPPRVVGGDAIELLPHMLQQMPQDSVQCVFHTHTINQFTRENRERLSTILTEYAQARKIFCRVAVEGIAGPHPQLEVDVWRNGIRQNFLLAYCHPHGRWIEWQADLVHDTFSAAGDSIV